MKCLKHWVKSGQKSLKYFHPSSIKKSYYISKTKKFLLQFMVFGMSIHIVRAYKLNFYDLSPHIVTRGRDRKGWQISTSKTSSLKKLHTKYVQKMLKIVQKLVKIAQKRHKSLENCVKKKKKLSQLWKICTRSGGRWGHIFPSLSWSSL